VQSAPDVRSVFLDAAGNEIGSRLSRSPRSFLTRGDSNEDVDEGAVPQANLIGVQKRVVPEPLATLLLWLNGGNLRSLGFLALGAFLVWEVVEITKEERADRSPVRQKDPDVTTAASHRARRGTSPRHIDHRGRPTSPRSL
jgi:hypothetical protein